MHNYVIIDMHLHYFMKATNGRNTYKLRGLIIVIAHFFITIRMNVECHPCRL